MSSTLSRDAARRLRPSGAFHLSPPAQPVGTTVTLTVENSPQQPEIVFTDTRRAVSWRVVMTAQGVDVWQADVMMPMEPTIVRYTFEFPDGTKLLEMRQDEGRNKPVFGRWRQAEYQLAVYTPAGMPPEWTQGMILYQIFPDRFANGDTSTDRDALGVYGLPPLFKQWDDTPEHPPLGRDFFGGDLRGVLDKLDYLAQLGVECVYFTPIFYAPTNHRYDAIDYLRIDPMLGTEADFAALLDAAHARGIRIVLDAVYNHCSVDSAYFKGAVSSKTDPHYRWFTFTDYPNKAVGWEGYDFMPEFVETPEVEEFFTGANGPTAKWTNLGVDGWRTDVTGCNSDEFWRRWRRRLDRLNPSNYTVAEEWENASHYLLGDMFSATMNYRFAWALWGFFGSDSLSASEFDDRLMVWLRDTPMPAAHAQMNLIDSHDTGRAFTYTQHDRARFMQMVAFQFAYVGAPMVYYGDEAGLTGDYAESARQTMRWDAIDPELHAHYTRLIARRRASDALRRGDVETVVLDDERRAYAFVRSSADQVVCCVFNAGDTPLTLDVPLANAPTGTYRDLTGAQPDAHADAVGLHVTLPARGYGWFAPAG